MAVVGLRNVTKVFCGRREAVTAVDDVTFTVGDGELVVLLGPSGCGKTTTLRLVAGLDRLSGGTIEIDGRVVNDVSPKDRDVALVFQDYALYPHLRVYDNLAFGLKMRRTPKGEIRRRVAEVAGLLGIEELLDRKPHALSGGQQQRVAFGRAIVRKPRVCLLDEPLANLDARLRVEVRHELKRLQCELGMTSLYVTHDQYEAMALGDRLVVLKDGAVQQIGRPSEVFDQPVNRFVAGFLGSPPMNFVVGTLTSENGVMMFQCVGGRVKLSARLARAVGDRTGGAVVLGIRPERVSIVAGRCEADELDAFVVRVTMSEAMGDHRNVYSRIADGQALVAKLPVTASFPAGEARAVLDTAGLALFEPGPLGSNVASEGGKVDVRTA